MKTPSNVKKRGIEKETKRKRKGNEKFSQKHCYVHDLATEFCLYMPPIGGASLSSRVP